MIRLDKFISDNCVMTRKEATLAIKAGRVCVNGVVATKGDLKFDETSALVTVDGESVGYKKFIYIMMNKPSGVVSATDDPRQPTVLSLLPPNYLTKGLFPVGRLDKDTVGLLILTNDGKNAHRLLSPKHHVEKEYYVECDADFADGDIAVCKKGMMMDEVLTKPCTLIIDDAKRNTARMILTEGKYHEIKRICAHLGKTVTFLERIRFGELLLDESLERGDWRELTEQEILLMG